ncbi:hydantoinase/oxoprolinase family protein [Oharaeibacter diazotrophicus]|uniref:Putative H4MPT-linked C1 transfer pathway protein n=2 Tax=Oharaeibacter diazotrophicus TaxID=1920512 RepID=A0A4R6RJA6_9HYPH|nr:hydantoinase/oxoprolinase family protein [Oharaeibacter diazotrophicus]TDP86603.1 putative H4MPT-linked C1 transfer pathway protein [Oharaeibacter diazotrophicus]BBE71456.1 hypothetical protein OHA_1_01030 [Pleomorphomonas sp. SM30]GLS78216.1 ATP synthase subunit C [Oharaeibacter diazotrophicus]
MTSTSAATIGWDIGGAHLKATRVEAGRIVAVVQEPCALWQGLDRLEAAFAAATAAIGSAPANPVTMTGELVDLFGSRAEGVAVLADAAVRRLAGVTVYAGAAGFVAPEAVADHVDRIASANWHATARLVGRAVADALVLDIGSTTTDVVPVHGGAVAARGVTDAERMAAGELIYTGAVRTALMALSPRAPVAGAWTGVMAEYFATIADANRLLGRLGPDDDRHATADGRDKSEAASRLRLSRMVGRDVPELDDAGWRAVAVWFAEAQIRAVHDGVLQVLSGAGLDEAAPVVTCGIGRAVAAEVARRCGRPARDLAGLLPVAAGAAADLAERASACAPASAVALFGGRHDL